MRVKSCANQFSCLEKNYIKLKKKNIIYSIEFERIFRLPTKEDWRFLAMKTEENRATEPNENEFY